MTQSIIDPRGFYFPQGAQQGYNLSQLSLAELISFADAARAKGEIAEAIELYECWLALNGDSPQAFAAYFNMGAVLGAAGKPLQAIRAYRECVRIKPDFLQARLNLGRALENAGRAVEAYEQWRVGFESLPQVNGEAIGNKCLLLIQGARLLEHHVDDAGTEKLLEHVIDIDPHYDEATRQWIGVRTRLCRWPAIVGSARASVREKLATIWPLSLATLSDDPMFQLARAYRHARNEFAPPSPAAMKAIKEARATAARKRRLKIGYVSSDFREHAVGLAMTQVFEKHDKSKVEVFAYYCGIDRDDPIRRRIVAAAEHWVDINPMSDEDAALQIARDGVDILVDLNGYTKFARTRLFSFRPAPVQVNWFGYPATMGTPYHHYIIADAGIIPEGDEIFYSEEVARLPCYQPNDRLREVAKTTPKRSDFGLPDDAFVYCSFNSTHKLTQRMFDSWLMILASTPGSVLWLLKASEDANARLRTYAAEHGLAPERIVFAEKVANPEHLARYPLADVFLDSFPYGAHTTASDALWMGVPVLTLQGRSFAARVCASLLTSAGVPELAAANEIEYRVKAVVLYHNRGELEALKQRLKAARENSPLFDIDRLVGALEGLYLEMAKREAKGRTPRPDLTNLEFYHEIALDFDLDAVNAMSRDAYFEAYRLALETADARYPLAPDSRLWRREPPDALLRATG
jgi:predicted O-linked N-acetylglucosamine transferase (SPINDLY family)